jgi:hypothetical protein
LAQEPSKNIEMLADNVIKKINHNSLFDSEIKEPDELINSGESRTRVLLSCVNSLHSLAGYDWESEEIFWACPSRIIKCCGACYDGSDLLIASDSKVTRMTPKGVFQTQLKGPYEALAHSVHVIDEQTIGVVDTGNSRVVLLNRKGEPFNTLNPLSYWGDLPCDAVHLNDFTSTPFGILASGFDYRPWRNVREEITWDDWCSGGYGLVMNLTGDKEMGKGRIIGCGVNHPHSLTFQSPYLYLCSSATGDFHQFEFDDFGILREINRIHVTDRHFLRGVHRVDDGWLLGGSSVRHGEVMERTTALYHLNEATWKVESRTVGGGG